MKITVTVDPGDGKNSADICNTGGGAFVTGVARQPDWGADARTWAIYHLVQRIAELEERLEETAA